MFSIAAFTEQSKASIVVSAQNQLKRFQKTLTHPERKTMKIRVALVFLFAAFLHGNETTFGGTIAVQWDQTSANEVTVTWNGTFDLGSNYTGPTSVSSADVYAQGSITSSPNGNQFLVNFVSGSSSPTVNLNLYTANNAAASGSIVGFSHPASGATAFSGTPFQLTYVAQTGGVPTVALPGTTASQALSGSAKITGTLTSIFPSAGERIALQNGPATTFNDGVGNIVTFQIVPEPSTYAMIATGAVAALAFASQRRRRAGR